MDEGIDIAPLSAADRLITWVSSEDNWLKLIVNEVLSARIELPESSIAEIYSQFLIEKGLIEGDLKNVVIGTPAESIDNTDDALQLLTLGKVKDVNKLAPNQTVTFNKRITLLYGENGVGKTGYARILKRAAAARTAEDILPNVYANGQPTDPSAEVTYSLGANNTSVTWNNERGLYPFTRLAVFDPKSVQFHVDEDLTFFYTPRELALFKHVHSAVESVRQLFEKEIQQRKRDQLPYLSRFTKGTSIYQEMETLGAATDLAKLRKLTEKIDESQIASLETRLEALKSGNVERELQTAREDVEGWTKLEELAENVKSLNLDELKNDTLKLKEKTEAQSKFSEESFSKKGVLNSGSNSWKDFIQSAEKYISDNFSEPYPSESSKCIYCLQPLDEKAVELLRMYEDFLKGKVADEIREINRTLSLRLRSVSEFDAVQLLVWLNSRISSEEAAGRKSDFLGQVRSWLQECQSVKQIGLEEMHALLVSIASNCKSLSEQISERKESSSKASQSLSSQTQDRKAAIETNSKELNELKDRKLLSSIFTEVEKFVEEAKWNDKATRLVKGFKTAARTMTDLSKAASEQLISQDFEKHFKVECEKLHCPSLNLDFPGKKGETARRKSIVPAHRVSEILSDGEQKVIALADFLAEVSVKEKNSPIIFDDPISSLDYKRLLHVVDRLYHLSSTRQIIVFTHNIWFAVELVRKFDKQRDSCSYYEIRESGDAKGIVEKGDHPRSDTWNNIRAKINSILSEAKKATDVTRDALVEKGYSKMRSICEVLIEEHVFKGVVKRFQPNVSMTLLPDINEDALKVAKEVVLPSFEKCCRLMDGHSQPLETLSCQPTVDNFESDWKTLQEAAEKIMKGSKATV